MTDNTQPKCLLCGEPMPAGEEMFNYHGYSGPCPKTPLVVDAPPAAAPTSERVRHLREQVIGLSSCDQSAEPCELCAESVDALIAAVRAEERQQFERDLPGHVKARRIAADLVPRRSAAAQICPLVERGGLTVPPEALTAEGPCHSEAHHRLLNTLYKHLGVTDADKVAEWIIEARALAARHAVPLPEVREEDVEWLRSQKPNKVYAADAVRWAWENRVDRILSVLEAVQARQGGGK